MSKKEETTIEESQDQFTQTILELDYTKDEKKREQLITKARLLAQNVPTLHGWPDKPTAFWNGEAFGWSRKIEPAVRQGIADQLQQLTGGLNLDLGAGSVAYIPDSITMDLSEEMLHLNDSPHKVQGNAETGLPFKDEKFDSVTMIFLISYLKNAQTTLKEARRILKTGGKLIIAQSANPIFALHRSHYQNTYELPELRILLKGLGFLVNSHVRDFSGKKILFIEAEKTIQRPLHA